MNTQSTTRRRSSPSFAKITTGQDFRRKPTKVTTTTTTDVRSDHNNNTPPKYPCRFCDKSFELAYQVRQHFKLKHAQHNDDSDDQSEYLSILGNKSSFSSPPTSKNDLSSTTNLTTTTTSSSQRFTQIRNNEKSSKRSRDESPAEVVEDLPRKRRKLSTKMKKRRKYHCTFCEKSFELSWQIKEHIKLKHPEENTNEDNNDSDNLSDDDQHTIQMPSEIPPPLEMLPKCYSKKKESQSQVIQVVESDGEIDIKSSS